ncbi:Uncharacterised protein [Slackia heliotrinireducens]|uniref:Streptococcal pilin isopeptide linkage domain-containing protein n=1 Tax=Slackia heliotrinireducens (strain ATCC 29202 / DSM 20476 / NCTC 11029 / RHS 1) TaxID=471855 RepID=C7N0P2_SLAHD|nr:hypothetical protein Shel_00450 [Slackia heliotrinireducens DSM 20476]VEH03640.1 Uncharacterised protein [Slackia heliotrinireducens]
MGTVTKGIRKAATVLIVAVACALMLAGAPSVAFGADGGLQVSQSYSESGDVPESVTGSFDYALTATSEGAAMPEGSSGNTYAFSLDGDGASITFPVQGSGPYALVFEHTGVYSYELTCTSTPSADGMTVDNSTYTVRICVDNAADGGLQMGWVEVRDENGEKPDEVCYSHSFEGAEPAPGPEPEPEPSPEPTPSPNPKPDSGPFHLPFNLPQTGDPVWMLIQMSGALCICAIAALVLAAAGKRRAKAAALRDSQSDK